MTEQPLYCQRCENPTVERWEHRVDTDDGPGWWIAQTCQVCRLRVVVRDDAYPERVGDVSEARSGYRQADGSVLWL